MIINNINKTHQYWMQTISHHSELAHNYSNPVRKTCPAMFVFNALEEFGFNRWHHIDKISNRTIQLMSSVYCIDDLTVWDAFYTSPQTKGNAEKRLKHIILKLKYQYHSRLDIIRCRIDMRGLGNDTFLKLNNDISGHHIAAPITQPSKSSLIQLFT